MLHSKASNKIFIPNRTVFVRFSDSVWSSHSLYVSSKQPWRDQMSLICLQSVQKWYLLHPNFFEFRYLKNIFLASSRGVNICQSLLINFGLFWLSVCWNWTRFRWGLILSTCHNFCFLTFQDELAGNAVPSNITRSGSFFNELFTKANAKTHEWRIACRSSLVYSVFNFSFNRYAHH